MLHVHLRILSLNLLLDICHEYVAIVCLLEIICQQTLDFLFLNRFASLLELLVEAVDEDLIDSFIRLF